jgi:metallothiol transferase
MENRVAKIKKIYAVWIYMMNLDESKKFYEDIIGLKFKFRKGNWIEFDLGETSFALLQRHRNEPLQPQKTRIMFQVDDIKTMQKRLEENGVRVIAGIRNHSYGKLLTFEDPNGHWLELFETNFRRARIKSAKKRHG